ncbi:mycothione reductase [Sphaerisporangium melleum]|uniref:Mycothione reductase n=1 Tax=Sphaerisporangium melleum TaxID=321316 RepID=A0A917VHB3_9ACTN|nr:mycothione reductase [Sphaerisporangium melleum]GGK77088.1 mycothione reductase [Sphaerisporangium melleum]GII71806.1 mycothione reductase [Sphaerisporangium melleum]
MRHYDLVVLGAGSGNMLLNDELAHLRTAVVEPDRFGGTCLNRGCIPTKMLVAAADAATGARAAARLGVNATVENIDWKAIRDRVFDRIDPLHDSALQYRRRHGVDVYTEEARFVAPKVLQVGSERISADTILVAVGSRPVVPDIAGLDTVPHHTSDTIMRIDEVPASMVIIGGGFIAAEFSHIFGALGSEITIVHRGPRLLTAEDEQVSARFTELAADRHRVLLNSTATSVTRHADGVAVHLTGPGGEQVVSAAALLVSVGRRPNTDRLDCAAGGLDLDEHGHIRIDGACRTSVPGVWAVGDVANHYQLKHMANAEVRVMRHNMLHPDDVRNLRTTIAPHAVFTDPQIASIGLTEQDARAGGIPYLVSVRDYADAAYGWALEDTTSFVKILADPAERTLLGAHIIGPQAGTLIQPLIQAMTLGQTVDQIARDVLYIHPAATEVVEQALLAL